MAFTKPTIILVHGAWHSPTHFSPLTDLLTSAGYTVNAVTLPSVHTKPAPPDFSADVSTIRSSILSAANSGQDVVVIAHSYGGIPSTEACRGVSKAELGTGADTEYMCSDEETVFYADCPPEAAAQAMKTLKPISKGAMHSKLTYPAWKYIDSSYLICEADQAIPVWLQESFVNQPGGRFAVARCKSAHSPFLSMPEVTANFVRRECGESL
ncbi:hypothetical protein H2203_008666 [Taxawa tesnikishii (nom. ined.)]|nr:hypothetical protein H2203_008666 [Dothideales sp. JES 119]